MSQANLILNLLQDNLPHRTDEIVKKCYGEGLSLSRIGARIYDLKKKGYQITGKRDDKIKTLYWYQLVDAPIKQESAITQTIKSCCYSYTTFGTHDPKCAVLEDLEFKAKWIERETERNLRLI